MNYPEKVMEDLHNQTYKDFEILWANDKGIVPAMNKALTRARGDIFVRIDDDVRLSEDWLSQIVRSFEDPEIGGVTGPTFVPDELMDNRDSIRYARDPEPFLAWLYDNDPYAVAKIYKCGSVSYGSNFINKLKVGEIDHLEGTNWAMRTDLIRKVGGFDPKFDGVAEWFDSDVVFKVKKLGYKIVYNRLAIVWHLLEKGEHYNDRFEGFGRIKNWLRFHIRHSRFHWKMVVFLIVWGGYFVCKKFRL